MELPVFDMAPFLTAGASSDEVQTLCRQMAECMHESGVLIVKDPRVSMQDNETFLSMLERYFEQPAEIKKQDERPEIYYQVGATPEFIENARCGKEPECLNRIDEMPEEDRPHKPLCPDAKERFFWRMGERPEKTEFASLNAEPVVPANFPEWSTVMNQWGSKLLTAVSTVAEMLALGLELDQHAFTQLMHCAPHLLAPTGTNLAKHGAKDTIYAGFHYDLSFLTIHGKSRFPGLYIWLRTGKKMLGGKQLEILTGGHVEAGYHEVVCAPETLTAIEKARESGRSLYRISSTLFSHIASDNVMQPLGKYGESEAVRAKYPPIKAGHQVQAELNAIKLAAVKQDA